MKKEKKLSVRLGILAGLVALGILGSTAGSLAWYAYSRTVTVSFVGTTVSSSVLLNVGIVDNEGYFSTDDLTTYGLERTSATDGSVTNSIVWSKSREGFSLTALRHYLDQSEFATDQLKPVTTKSRTYNDSADFKLYSAPEFSYVDFDEEADPSTYVELPFAFRVMDENSAYIPSKNVWLTDAVVQAEENAESAIRVYVDGVNQFLMQPADDRNAIGETKVGGVLSIGPSDYYDYDIATNKEYCYGEFVNTPTYSALAPAQYGVIDNINDVDDATEITTFNAKHYNNVLVPDLDAAQPKVQEHAGLGKVKPSIDSAGQLYTDTVNGNGIPVGVTSTESKVAYTTIKIFAEGWDHAIVDQKAGFSFNLGLKFEIDRI